MKARQYHGRGRILVASFIAFHLVAIPIVALPSDIFPFHALRHLVAPYMRCIGLNQSFDMFAPNPKTDEQYLKALIVERDGAMAVYSFPRMEELSLVEKYRKERYRKFVESVVCQGCSGLWPDIAAEAARRVANPANPARQVTLIKFQSPIDPRASATGDDAHAKASIVTEQTLPAKDLP